MLNPQESPQKWWRHDFFLEFLFLSTAHITDLVSTRFLVFFLLPNIYLRSSWMSYPQNSLLFLLSYISFNLFRNTSIFLDLSIFSNPCTWNFPVVKSCLYLKRYFQFPLLIWFCLLVCTESNLFLSDFPLWYSSSVI